MSDFTIGTFVFIFHGFVRFSEPLSATMSLRANLFLHNSKLENVYFSPSSFFSQKTQPPSNHASISRALFLGFSMTKVLTGLSAHNISLLILYFPNVLTNFTCHGGASKWECIIINSLIKLNVIQSSK